MIDLTEPHFLLPDCEETTVSEILPSLLNFLEKNTTVTVLELKDHSLCSHNAVKIGPMLRINTTITSMDLTNTDIDDEVAFEIINSLKVNSTITELNLSKNEIGPEGVEEIEDVLKRKIITKLDLSHNSIGLDVVSSILTTDSSLKSVLLSVNYIGTQDDFSIARNLEISPSITEIALKHNSIGPKGCFIT